ncbi:hypothetical protein Agub_g15714, partial [Astrephomene gubernaculifera]
AIAVVAIIIAVGVGVGVGIGATKGKKLTKKEDVQSSQLASPPPPAAAATSNERVANLTTVKNKLLGYIPVDIKNADTNELIDSYILQISRIQPVTQILSYILPVMGFNGTVVQPQAIQMKIHAWLEESKVDSSSLVATIDNLA